MERLADGRRRRTRPAAAWNPVAGFTDPAGRLLWVAARRSRLLPVPARGRLDSEPGDRRLGRARSAVAEVPEDALALGPGTGVPRKAGPGRQAGARVVYRVLASRFHDDTQDRGRGSPPRARPRLAHPGSGGDARDRAGTRAPGGGPRPEDRDRGARVRRGQAHLRGPDRGGVRGPAAGEPGRVGPDRAAVEHGALAAPGPHGGGGRPRARRLLRARAPGARRALARPRPRPRARPAPSRAPRRAGRPAARAGRAGGRVTPDEAPARWAALRAFHDASGHFLVTNGPYRLASWTEDTSVLPVFRDFTYPLGVGVFDSFAIPLRAFVTGAEVAPTSSWSRPTSSAIEKFGREYRIVREPFVKRAREQDRRSLPVGHYVVVGPDGAVAAAGTAEASEPGDCRVDLRAVDRRRPVRGPRRADRRRQPHRAAREGGPVDTLVIHVLNALLYASVLFLIAGGLTLIYGVMRIVNLAHGNLYALRRLRHRVGGRPAGGARSRRPRCFLLAAGRRRAAAALARRDPRADAAAAALPARGGVPAAHHVRAPPDPRGPHPPRLGSRIRCRRARSRDAWAASPSARPSIPPTTSSSSRSAASPPPCSGPSSTRRGSAWCSAPRRRTCAWRPRSASTSTASTCRPSRSAASWPASGGAVIVPEPGAVLGMGVDALILAFVVVVIGGLGQPRGRAGWAPSSSAWSARPASRSSRRSSWPCSTSSPRSCCSSAPPASSGAHEPVPVVAAAGRAAHAGAPRRHRAPCSCSSRCRSSCRPYQTVLLVVRARLRDRRPGLQPPARLHRPPVLRPLRLLRRGRLRGGLHGEVPQASARWSCSSSAACSRRSWWPRCSASSASATRGSSSASSPWRSRRCCGASPSSSSG